MLNIKFNHLCCLRRRETFIVSNRYEVSNRGEDDCLSAWLKSVKLIEFLSIAKVPETSYPPSGVQRAEENTTGITGAHGAELPQSLSKQNRKNSGRHKPAYQVCTANFIRFPFAKYTVRCVCLSRYVSSIQ